MTHFGILRHTISLSCIVFLGIGFSALWCSGLAHAAERPRLAVMDLKARGDISRYHLELLNEVILTELRQLDQYQLITGRHIRSLLARTQAREKLGCDAISCLAEIGESLDVRYVLASNVARFGGEWAINIKLIDPKQSEVRKSLFRRLNIKECELLDQYPLAIFELFETHGAPTARQAEEDRNPASQTTALAPSPRPIGIADAQQSNASYRKLHALGFDKQSLARLWTTMDGHQLEKMVQASERLLRRGFSTDELIEFAADLDFIKHPRPERYALYLAAGLPPEEYSSMIRKRLTLEEFYNHHTESTLLEIGKWVCLGAGGLFTATGAILYPDSDKADRRRGKVMLGVGGVLLAGFITTALIDLLNSNDVPKGFFQSATRQQILELAGHDPVPTGRPRVSALAITPIVDETTAGLGLGLRF